MKSFDTVLRMQWPTKYRRKTVEKNLGQTNQTFWNDLRTSACQIVVPVLVVCRHFYQTDWLPSVLFAAIGDSFHRLPTAETLSSSSIKSLPRTNEDVFAFQNVQYILCMHWLNCRQSSTTYVKSINPDTCVP